MILETRFNIEVFKINNYADGYKHFLYFLIKYFFNSENFSGTIKKQDYIKRGIELGFEKRFLENVYDKGKKDNKFLKINFYKNGIHITLKSLIDKEQAKNLIVYIENELLERIKDLNDFRYLCYMIVACRPLKTENNFKQSEYFYKSPSRTIKSIGSNFGNIEKDVMSKRLNEAKKHFPDIFNITSRYTTYEYYNKKYIIQISNLYSIKQVIYKLIKNKVKQKSKGKDFEKRFFYVDTKYIKSQNQVFGNWKNVNGFLPSEWYEILGKKIKEEVFKS
ncbi:hypothetical protein H3C61_01265 [Candidatus Gracilibacteria bacterium]|nr:hypothetical protein [Candidatus Gracilibacteria bacterium]